MTDEVQTQSVEKRAVGAALGIGILLLPIVFAWFTLRQGYGKTARIVSLTWMGLWLAIGSGAGGNKTADSAEESSVTSNSMSENQSTEDVEDVEDDPNANGLTKVNQEVESRKVNLPRLALACGGDGYRNGRIVFDPVSKIIYKATIIDKTSEVSKSISIENGKIHALLGPKNSDPKTEIIFDTTTNSYKYNYNYIPEGDETASACYEQIDAAKRDCAEAANINQCIEIRHPGVMGKIISGICSQSSSKWIDMQCDPIDDNEYQSTLDMVKNYSGNL